MISGNVGADAKCWPWSVSTVQPVVLQQQVQMTRATRVVKKRNCILSSSAGLSPSCRRAPNTQPRARRPGCARISRLRAHAPAMPRRAARGRCRPSLPPSPPAEPRMRQGRDTQAYRKCGLSPAAPETTAPGGPRARGESTSGRRCGAARWAGGCSPTRGSPCPVRPPAEEITLQQIMAHLDSIRKDMVILEKSEFANLRAENEKMKIELDQVKQQLTNETGKIRADNKLDVNLERSRVTDMDSRTNSVIAEISNKIDTEIASLKTLMESNKLGTIRYLAASVFACLAIALGFYRFWK
uniref:Coiled-coil domain containing 90B n=1 Tax=Crocodylus porosus TaxID=8502 RepID=A0A7M4FI98_CROPO